MMEETIKVVRLQKGFQESFVSSPADITIAGGSAGCGKTFASIFEGVKHDANPDFGAIFFRRTFSQIKNTGGLWDESKKIYPLRGATPNESDMSWKFPSGAKIRFSHLQHEKDIYSHQGAQYALIIFDELTHFSESMFWYILSRNRSTCGVKPYIKATCNPDPDSFVARLIEWWIDQETGFPITERACKLRYFVRYNDNMAWGDSKEEIINNYPFIFENFPESKPEDLIKSLTFIPGSIYENQELLKVNPEYLANLLSQDEATRAKLLDGNWKIRQDNTSLFDFAAINDVFSNFISDKKTRYITCDAARFGRDFCVIMTWQGWEVIQIEVIKKSDVHDIIKSVEASRARFNVPKSNVLIDQDGVGAGTVKTGGYKGFSGGEQPKKIMGGKENYKNLKTQCYYYVAEKINTGDMNIIINNETCIVDGVRSTKIKIGAKIMDISELIRNDLRAIKRENIDNDGKQQINSKEEQKAILGRSPDFADTIMERAVFDFVPKSTYL